MKSLLSQSCDLKAPSSVFTRLMYALLFIGFCAPSTLYAPRAQECTVVALGDDIQSVINSLNIIGPKITNIQQIVTIILQLIGNLSANDQIIISKLDVIESLIANINVSVSDTLCCSVLEDLISRDDALILSKLDEISSQIASLNISVLPCTVSGLDEIERLISIGDATILSKLDSLSVSIPDSLCCSILEDLISKDDAYLGTKIDNLSVQVSINDAVILSALASPCAAIPITANTTITTSGFYCLANNSVQNITISASDVVVDLNNHVVIGAVTVNATNDVTIGNGVVRSPSTATDAIAVNGTSNIRLSHVRAENGRRGMFMNGVQSGAVSNCEFTSNFTGIELVSSADVTIEESTARRNQYSGFSLASSFTNSIRDCKAINSGQGNTNQVNNNVYGFVAFNSTSNIFENCIANATQALSTTDYNSIVAGFALTGTSNCNKIIGCEAANAITNASGVTVPYGIYLQGALGSTLTLTAIPPIPVPDGNSVNAVQWSPDRQYVAVGMSFEDTYRLRVYAFDGVNEVLQQIAVPDQRPGDQVNTVDWSPDGKYLAAGMLRGSETDIPRIRIYSFDSTNNSLTQVAIPAAQLPDSVDVYSVRWSPDGKYLAAGGTTNLLTVYAFDRVNNTLTLQSSAQLGANAGVHSVDWSSNGLYIAAGTDGTPAQLGVYSFIPSSSILSLAASGASAPGTAVTITGVRWSPDCSFIAISAYNVDGYIGVYQFTQATGSSSASVVLKTSQIFAGKLANSVDWSGDGRYIVVGIEFPLFLRVYGYDRGSNVLSIAATPNITPVGFAVFSVDWSPDGQYIVAGTESNPNQIYIYKALTFPYDNFIKDNIVYCNSGNSCPGGVGICGSSICNMIIQNTAYSNPINPIMASSNYQFVCNVFNQFFGQAPTLMQNIALGSCEPIGIPDDTALLIKQAKAEIEILSQEVSIGDALILSAIEKLSISVPDSLCCSILENLISKDDAYLATKIDNLSLQTSIGDAVILSAIANITLSALDLLCCLILENMISVGDATIETKIDNLSTQVSIGDAAILSALSKISISLPDSLCCSILENLISKEDAYLGTKIDNLSTQVSIGDAVILSALEKLSISVPDSLCCSILENLISVDDAYLATKIDTVLSQFSIIEKDIFSKIDAASCCSVLENLISADDAYLATKIDNLSLQTSISDALILSAIGKISISLPDLLCCSILENLISVDDAYLATKIDTVLSQLSIIEKDIFSKIDAASCCSVLENLISADDAYLATKIDNLSLQTSIGDAVILSAIAKISISLPDLLCCSILENLISKDDAYLATKIDTVLSQLSIVEKDIFSKIDAASCCSVLENLISADDAYLATKIDSLSLQVSINDAVILSALDRTNCCSVLENLISADDAYLATKIDNLSLQTSIGDAAILSALDRANCCSVLENLISADDAYLATKIDNLSLQTSIGDAAILSALDRANCCSVLENLISADDAYLATKIDNLSLQTSIGDAAILSALDRANCCSVLENLISVDDAYLATKIDTVLSQLSIVEKDIFSKIDAASCCSVLENLISADDAYLATKIDNLSLQTSIGDAAILSALDRANCCSVLENLISADDAYLATKIDNLSLQTSIGDAAILSALDRTNCCSVLENLISVDDAYLATKIDNLSLQTSIGDAAILSALDRANCCSVLENLISADDAYLATKIDNLSLQTSIGDATILSALDRANCCSVLENLISADDAYLATKVDNLSLQVSINDAVILSALISPCAATPIIANTTITTSGFYCLANNSVSLIVISASDVVVDLNNHVVIGVVTVNATNDVTIGNGVVRSLSTANDAITVNGTSNIKLSNVRAENGRRGIYMNGVQSGAVSNCEFTSNFTGIELISSADVTIEKSAARRNQYSGFSLASSFTNTIRDCTAMNSGQGNTNQLNNNVYGFVAFNSTSNIFENCIANATQALSTTDYNSIVAGFALTGTSNCNKIIGCEAANAITNASGVTVPYGIYLQNTFSGLVSLTVVAPGPLSDPVAALSWSSDGQYLVVGLSSYSHTNVLKLYRYNRTTNGLVLLQSINFSSVTYDDALSLQWSPDGNYLGVGGAIGTNSTGNGNGVIIYQFDRTIEQLTQVASVDPFGAGVYDAMYTFAWSPDGQYFAVGGNKYGYPHSGVFVYTFNTITQSINLLTTIVPPGGNDRIWTAQWSPDGNYLAFGGGIVNANDLFVYSFNRGTGTFAFVTSVPASGGTTYNFFETLAWSPDGNYLAVGGSAPNPGQLVIYRFNRGNSPGLVQMDTSSLITIVRSVAWSPDGRFLSVYGHGAGNTGATLNVFTFDRGTQKLGLLQSLTPTASTETFLSGKVAWSPDGRLLAVGDQHFPGNFNLIIYQALSFPSDNMIMNNTVYCNSGAQYPSGVGISGSSICNMIIQNTAYSNPINPSIVSSNYYFVCNVFNQLFGQAPSLLQNIALGSCEPIALQDNTALLVKQTKALLSSKIDALSLQTSIGDAAILSALDRANCCSVLENLISVDDAHLATKIDTVLSQLSIVEKDIFSKIDAASCCSVLENLVSADDAYLATKIDNLSLQTSIGDAAILSALDRTNCCSVLENLISADDAYLATKIDNLSLQVSINDAVILTALASPCAAIPITTNTTITTSGFYCLANNSVQNITINASDVVVDLNNHVVIGAVAVNATNDVTIGNGVVRSLSTASDAITVSGTSNIRLSHVRAENGQRGIFMNGVQSGVVSNCEFTLNFTGIELVASADVTIEESTARRNQYSGFSLASSFTNTIRDCTAMNSGQGNTNQVNNNVYGFVAFNSTSNVFENCIANATQALSTTDYNSIVAGFALTGTSNYNKIIGCEAANAVTNASGVTVPYGIYLQGTLGSQITLTAVPPIPVPGGNSVNAVQWSPDRRFIAVGASSLDTYRVRIYAFDAVNALLQQVAVPDQIPGDTVNSVDWSGDGKYLAAGMDRGSASDIPRIRIYSFDSTNNSLTQVAIPAVQLPDTIDVHSVRWSPDGKYLAAGGTANLLAVYAFDRVNDTLTLQSSAQPSDTIDSVDWSGDGRYIAAGLDTTSALNVYAFIPTNSSLLLIASVAAPSLATKISSVRWSPDCSFIAVGASFAGEVSGGYIGIYRFAPATGSSSASVVLLTFTLLALQPVNSVDWSSDGRYIVAGFNGSPFLRVYGYDRGDNQLISLAAPNILPLVSQVQCVDWSPDGQYICAVTSGVGDPKIYLYHALTFSYDNVVKENTVYCNSGNSCPGGVGISGSSICNYIVDNTAYSNPINPVMASSNYQFVCNVFNQLFGNAPTLLQNIALGSCEPIAIPDNTATLQKQTLARIGQLTDGASCLPTLIDVPQDINNLDLNVIQLLKTILLELRGCGCTS